MRLLIQVLDERNCCVLSEDIVDVPDEMYYPPDQIVVTLDGVKTAIDYHAWLAKQKAN